MLVLKNFIKYQSLGNDFIIFDWYKKPSIFMQNELHDVSWKRFVARICDRHFGVGADGVLIITGAAQTSMPEVLVFNADGGSAQTCLNGLRCVADYLFLQYHFPEQFTITMGSRAFDCSAKRGADGGVLVETKIAPVVYDSVRTITNLDRHFDGHVVSVGNPHFIIFEQVAAAVLASYGKALETHASFPAGTNVEFVWSVHTTGREKVYAMLVHERGCGITLACSSGAAATVGLLGHQGSLAPQEKIVVRMQGGDVLAWIDEQKHIVLRAQAQQIFKGTFDDQIEVYSSVQQSHASRV